MHVGDSAHVCIFHDRESRNVVQHLESLHSMNQRSYDKPSLDNAHARVRRARNHLTLFKRHARKFFTKMPIMAPSLETDLAEGDFVVISNLSHLIPSVLSILIGECIYNLRAALDYLIYELAILDSGQVQEKTQFPIRDDPKGWEQLGSTSLKGLTRKHMAAIECLQPYKGCNWTKVLRDISNPDKHRTLVFVEGSSVTEWSLGKDNQADPSTSLRAMKLHAEVYPSITFSDERPVIKTLQELHANVARVLECFNAEFNGN